jgi:hypothetical protein
LADNLVIAPCATGLATMVDPGSASRNYPRLEQAGALGRHGFYDALDYTGSRLPTGGTVAVTVLAAGRTTPAAWIDVVANPAFGFQASADGSGCTWAESSTENQLTAWSNDPTAGPAGEGAYVRDDDTGALWTATAQPIRDGGTYIAATASAAAASPTRRTAAHSTSRNSCPCRTRSRSLA